MGNEKPIIPLCSSARGLALCQNATGQASRAICREVMLVASEAPEWVMLIPAGKIVGFDGRKFKNDRPDDIVKAFKEHPHDLPIDWEHSTQLKGQEGDEAPAAAWIVDIENRNGDIWVQVKWNARGKASIESKEYRYISPTFWHDRNGRVTELAGAGLTNNPNLDLPALSRSQTAGENPEEEPMLKELLKLLGLAETTTEAQALEAVKALNASGIKSAEDLKLAMQSNAKLADELAEIKKAKEKTDDDLKLAVAARKTPDLELWVPRADYDLARNRTVELEAELAKGKKEQLDAEINTAIEEAKKAGKITPATEEFYRASCSQDGGLERFKKFVADAPKVITDPKTPATPPGTDVQGLSAEEMAVCALTGTSPESMASYKKDPVAWAKAQAPKDAN